MKKWIYKVIEFNTTGLMGGVVNTNYIESRLNELGEFGWEVVSGHTTAQDFGSSRRVIYTLKKEGDNIGNNFR